MMSLPSCMAWVSIHSSKKMADDVTSFLYVFGEYAANNLGQGVGLHFLDICKPNAINNSQII